MTERRELKKRLAHWKKYKAALPRLIDCSRVYGDYTYTNEDLAIADRAIAEIEQQLAGHQQPSL